MPNIDRKDVQGLLRTGYPKARHAAYHLLEIADGKAAKAWLAGLIKSITFADKEHPSTEHLNIAFTAAGLEKLGLPHDAMQTFPGVFREGMPLDHRAGILGDVGPSAPQNWDWGGTSGDAHAGRLHVLLLAFAHSGAGLATLNANLAGGFGTAVVALPGSPLATRTFDSDNNYEHFGFRDGISQPLVEGINDEAAKEKATSYSSVVEPGEFVLGYKNSRNLLAPSPSVAAAADPLGILKHRAPGMRKRRDLGRNSSFLVFRQLAQDVPAFWNYVHAASPIGTDRTLGACEPLAAKLVGRWCNGTSLAKAWAKPDPEPDTEKWNDFAYRDADAAGLRCPVGAHIRRAAPRDSLADTKEDGLISTGLHRLLRRGRSYGEALSGDAKFSGDQQKRGLYFICLNASIERQFEFVQQTWINGSKVGGLYDERDPIAGNPQGGGKFSIPGVLERSVLAGMPSFVTVKGGGYFFLPGREALVFLST